MKRAPRVDAKRLDLSGFEAWLRSQLSGAMFAAVVTAVLQIVRALFEQNTQLRQRILARRTKPPSERLSAVERQMQFEFAVPANDLVPAPGRAGAGSNATDESSSKTRRRSGGRQPLPKHITVVDVANDLAPEDRICPDCGIEMKGVRRRCTHTFNVIPAQLVLERRMDEVVACPKCDAMACARAPGGVLDGGLLGTTLVTECLANKILDGMPVERQALHYQRQGAPISPSTLGRAMGALLDHMMPLAALITSRIRGCERVQLDSTGLRVLDPGSVTGTWRDTLWGVIGDGQWVSFAAMRSGDSQSLEEWMREMDASVFQCDGTSTTNFVERKWHRCRPGCHAHARHKLVEAARRGDLRAMTPIRLYAKLFKIEADATRDRVDPEVRRARRESQSAILLEQLREWVTQIAPDVEPKSPLGQAITYLQRQWMRLCLFLLDGAIEVTNNRSERELRPWVRGQHTWLFVGDQRNAQRWAAGFSVMHTAIAHGANARAYLHAVAERLVAGHSHTRLDELLPDAMLLAHPEIADPLRAKRAVAALPIPDPRAA
jgi:transposase